MWGLDFRVCGCGGRRVQAHEGFACLPESCSLKKKAGHLTSTDDTSHVDDPPNAKTACLKTLYSRTRAP